jgi:hypothetical protein
MPEDFLKCVREKGKVRTIDVKDHPDMYLHVCYDAKGKSHSGEPKKKKMNRYSK